MQPVVSDAPRANADGAATQMKRKPSPAGVSRLFRPRHRHQKFRMLDEPGPDELLDDWMISGPATEPTSSDQTYFLDRFFRTLAPFLRASERPIAIACFLLLTFAKARLCDQNLRDMVAL